MIKRKTIIIRKPYYGAGSEKQYGWTLDGHGLWGVGIDMDIINEYDSLDVIVNKERYRVSTDKAKEFVKKYNSYYKVRNYNKILGIVSLSIMRNMTTQGKDKPKPEGAKPTSTQGKLL